MDASGGSVNLSHVQMLTPRPTCLDSADGTERGLKVDPLKKVRMYESRIVRTQIRIWQIILNQIYKLSA